jgi:hypothetical protein
MTIRAQVLALPRVEQASLTPAEAKSLGDAVEEARQRLCGAESKHWRKRWRPPSLLLPSVAQDLILVLQQLELPAGWWRDGATEHQCLIVEILKLVVADARKAGARIHTPDKYWQRVLRLANELQQPSWTIRRRGPAGWVYF